MCAGDALMATTLDRARTTGDADRRIARSDNIAGWTFAGPSVIIVLGLSFIPMIWAAYLSFTNSNLVSGGHFIGLANYAALRKDPTLRQAFANTLLLAVLYLPIGLAAGLGVAIMLNQKIKMIGFYRTCFLVPFIASAAAEGLLFDFSRKHADKTADIVEANDATGRSVRLGFDPRYGRPSILAYRVLQAIFRKLTSEGYPFGDNVSFSRHEILQLAGRGTSTVT